MKQHFAITAQQVVQDCETREEETNEVIPTKVFKLAPKAVSRLQARKEEAK